VLYLSWAEKVEAEEKEDDVYDSTFAGTGGRTWRSVWMRENEGFLGMGLKEG
jgi:hypothetical protein